jgi:RNA polymerase sigma factor (sigma-70 family)
MSSAGGSTESDVLERLVVATAQGDRDAQAELIARYWPLIRDSAIAAKRRAGGRALALEETADVEQRVALRVLGALEAHEWRGESAFAAWIRKLAKAEIVDLVRRGAAQKRDAPEVWGSVVERVAASERTPESRIDGENRARLLLDRLGSLKVEHRTALVLHHMGYSHAQVAETLGCTPEAARKLVTRARAKLLRLNDG